MIDRASEREDSRRETLEKAVSGDQASVDGGIIDLHPRDATQLFDPMDPSQPPDELSTKQAARAVTRWKNEGGRTLPPDRRSRATK